MTDVRGGGEWHLAGQIFGAETSLALKEASYVIHRNESAEKNSY
jgi:hypothetical protein